MPGHYGAERHTQIGLRVEKVDAELKQGVLTLHLPKSAARRTRVVPVKAS